MGVHSLYQIPDDIETLTQLYCFSETELALIRQRRGEHNRLGFAVIMSLLKYPGDGNCSGLTTSSSIIAHIAKTLSIKPIHWSRYSERDKTRGSI